MVHPLLGYAKPTMVRLQDFLVVQPRINVEIPLQTTTSSSECAGCTLTVTNLSYTILPSPCNCTTITSSKPHPLLSSISFSAKSSCLTAVLGPSGAGKSTLLRAISGRATGNARFDPSCISFNHQPISSSAHLRRLCGFVTQEDNLLPRLTVRETIEFSARFCLRDVGEKERHVRVQHLMEELGLVQIADSYVGDISGGERRRVSIAADVIHDPPVLLLDEPTSGLDSTSALQVVELLAGMARARRRIVILTVHQPGYRMLQHMSTYLLLFSGAVAHFGDLRSLEETIGALELRIPRKVGTLEFAVEISSKLQERYQSTSLAAGDDNNMESPEQCDSSRIGCFRYLGRLDEVSSLASRYWRITYRTRQLFVSRALQAVIGGVGLGSVYLRMKPGGDRGAAERLGLFSFTLSFLLSSTVEALPLFLQERKVLMKELSRGMYRASSYLIANTVVSVPFLLVAAFLFSTPLYFLVGLNPSFVSFFFFVLVVWMVFMMASSLVLLIGAATADLVLGNSMIAVVLGVFFLFSGFFIPRESMPGYLVFMHYVSPYRYPLDALLVNEYWGSRERCLSYGGGYGRRQCEQRGRDVLRRRGLERDVRWENVAVMLGFFLLYRVISWMIVVRRASKTTF